MVRTLRNTISDCLRPLRLRLDFDHQDVRRESVIQKGDFYLSAFHIWQVYTGGGVVCPWEDISLQA